MADKLDTRVKRSYTHIFDTLEEKAAAQAHAKRGGRTLAGLVRYLLQRDMEEAKGAAPPTSSQGA